MTPETPFGRRLRSAIRGAGLTQGQFANRIGVDKSAISMWRRGHHMPRIDVVRDICHILRISADWLLDIKTPTDTTTTTTTESPS